MILDRQEYEMYSEFVFDLDTNNTLTMNAVRALTIYRDSADDDEYVVIRVNGYYAITKIIDEWQPIEVREFVQPFDEKRVYPLQKVKKKIDWA